MKLGRLNHIGVATPSIADSIIFYRDVMGATHIGVPFDLPEQGVRVYFIDTSIKVGFRKDVESFANWASGQVLSKYIRFLRMTGQCPA